MRHVAFVVPTLDRLAGAERQVLLLAEGLRQRGWRVSVVTLSGNGSAVRAGLGACGADFFSLEMRKGLADPRGWMRFRRWLGREAPDVVHAHLPHAAWMGRWSRLLARMPVVIDTIHSSHTGGLSRQLGYRLSGWLSDGCSAVSEGVAEAWRSAHMVRAERLVVIPNGVDVDRWRPDAAGRNDGRRKLGLGEEFVWFTAGRLDPVKDYPTLLRAMIEVPEPGRLVIAGAGPEEGRLRGMAAELGIESRVRFLGFEPDVLTWMQAADAVVLASRWEGLPMTLLEAGACGLAAVATDVAGSREIVADGETGFLAPAGDAVALGTVMKRMMCLDANERLAMGQKARRNIVARYSLAGVLDSWEGMYGELLERGARHA